MKSKVTTQQWEWLISELKLISRVLKVKTYMSQEDIEDTISDILEILVKKPKRAIYIYETQNTAYLTKMFKATISNYLILENFDNTKHVKEWKKIRNVADRYNIELIPANAYKIEAFIEDKRLTIPIIEEILKEKRNKVSLDDILRKIIIQEKYDE